MNQYKLLFLAVLSFICIFGFSQLAVVTGGNVGGSFSAGYLKNNPTGKGFEFSAGITTSFYEVFFPEIDFAREVYSLGLDSAGSNIEQKGNYIGVGVNNKLPIGSIALGKSSKGECWYLNLKLLFDYKYRFKIGTSALNMSPANQSGINLGIGIRPTFSGADKSRVAWSYFYDFYYHLDLNKSDYSNISGIQQNGFFFRFTLLHYKTSDMLGGGSKKKAYNRKY